MIRALFVACLVIVPAALAQTPKRIPYAFSTGNVPTNQQGDPAFWALPNGGQLVTLDTYMGGVFPSFIVDGGVKTSYFPGIFRSADSRGDVLALSGQLTGDITIAWPDGGVLADGGIDLIVQPLVAQAAHQLALRALDDAGFEVWSDNGADSLNHSALNRVGGGGFALTPLGSLMLPQPPTGIAVDDKSGRVVVVQPTLGLLLVEPDSSASFMVSIDAGQLGTSVTAVDLLSAADGRIFAFSTARNDGVVFITEIDGFGFTVLGSFRIVQPDGGLNGALTPHAIDVEQRAFPGFPNGAVFVEDEGVHDFKVIDLALIAAQFPTIPLTSSASDGGVGDGGTGNADGGTADGGTNTTVPSGPNYGGDGSGTPRSLCGCTSGPFGLLPLLAVLWWWRRRSV